MENTDCTGFEPVKELLIRERRGFAPSKRLYYLLIDYLMNSREKPNKRTLVAEVQPSIYDDQFKNCIKIRKAFESWARRMNVVDDKLIHKQVNKVIIPREEIQPKVLEIHQSESKHLEVNQTISQIRKEYTWGSKEFGMNRMDVTLAILQCPQSSCRIKAETERRRMVKEFRDSCAVPNRIKSPQVRPVNNRVPLTQCACCKADIPEDLNAITHYEQLIKRVHQMVGQIKSGRHKKGSLDIDSQLTHCLSLCSHVEKWIQTKKANEKEAKSGEENAIKAKRKKEKKQDSGESLLARKCLNNGEVHCEAQLNNRKCNHRHVGHSATQYMFPTSSCT